MAVRSIAMEETLQRHRFSVDDYEQMVEMGIFTPEDKVELLRGEIIVMSPSGGPHAASITRVGEAFGALRGVALQRTQLPIRLEDSEPEPDVALVLPCEDFYAARHPGPADILLAVEVSDSSHYLDLKIKRPLYAENGIREYWIVDIRKRQVDVHRDPEEGEYRDVTTAGPGQTVSPLAFPDLVIRVDDLLPRSGADS